MFLKTPLGALHRKILALKINVYTIYKRHFIIFQNQRKLFFQWLLYMAWDSLVPLGGTSILKNQNKYSIKKGI